MDMGSEETQASSLSFDDVGSIDDYFCFKKFLSVKQLSFSLTGASPQEVNWIPRIPTRLWENSETANSVGAVIFSCVTDSQKKVIERKLQA